MSRKLFVGSLSWGTDDASLRAAFEGFGQLEEAVVIRDRETGQSRGFAFVTFADVESATKAQRAMDGAELDGRRLRIDFARDDAGGGGPGGGGGGYGGPPRRGGFDRPPSGDRPPGGGYDRPRSGGFDRPPGDRPSGDRPFRRPFLPPPPPDPIPAPPPPAAPERKKAKKPGRAFDDAQDDDLDDRPRGGPSERGTKRW